MRAAFDLTALRSGATGVARYVRGLHDALVATEPGIDLATFTVGRGLPVDVPVQHHLPVPLRAVHRSWARIGRPHVETLVGAVDISHALDLVPAPTRAPLVMTVHDVVALRLPDRFPARAVRIARLQAIAARDRAAVVLADCEASAAEISEAMRVERQRIVVTPLGHRPVPDPLPAPAIEPPYLLFVGTVTQRKGLTWLAEAIAGLPPSGPPLVVAGGDGHDGAEVRAAVAASAGDRVRFLGRVDDDTLTALYAHALALCHPSEAEGFGLPVLEAMAFGVPVVACDIPPVREVGGDAVVLAPPRDPAAFRDALGGLIGDDRERARLRSAGLQRAASYTWEACAAVVAGVYRSLA